MATTSTRSGLKICPSDGKQGRTTGRKRRRLRWQAAAKTTASAALLLSLQLGHVLALAPWPEQASRRKALGHSVQLALGLLGGAAAVSPADVAAAGASRLAPPPEYLSPPTEAGRQSFPYREDWTGSALKVRSIREAAAAAVSPDGAIVPFSFGRWPDPALRRPARPVPRNLFGGRELRAVAEALKATARSEGAVGLAAQQCGVDARLLWIDTVAAARADEGTIGRASQTRTGTRKRAFGKGTATATATAPAVSEGKEGDRGIYLVNPRIVARSSELDMRAWTEFCLVLPPTFQATVLRDAGITVEFETLRGESKRVEMGGELSRCVQHEMDHDRGILITDHVGLSDLEGGPSGTMAELESYGHEERRVIAYGRDITESSLDYMSFSV